MSARGISIFLTKGAPNPSGGTVKYMGALVPPPGENRMPGSPQEMFEAIARKTYVSFNRNKQFLKVLPKKGELVLGFALPGDLKDDRLLPAKNIGGLDRIKGTWTSGTRPSSKDTWTWSSPPTRRTEVSTNVINRPQPSGGYARANGYQEGPR